MEKKSERKEKNMPALKEVTTEAINPAELQKSFYLLIETTEKLRLSHEQLQKQVKEVSLELEKKNQELEKKVNELDSTREYLYRVIDSMNSGLVTVDKEGKIITFNKAAEQILGYKEAEVKGKNLEEIFYRKQASEFLVPLKQARNMDNLEEDWFDKEGEKKRIKGTASPLFEPGDSLNILGATIIFSDLSKVRLLEEKVRRADRLAALGALAAGVAHEMRNPLTTIRGYIQMFPQLAAEEAFREEFSDNVLREIDRLTHLTEELLDLSRPVNIAARPEPLVDIINSAIWNIEEAREQSKKKIVFNSSSDFWVRVDKDRIKQVFINILINALQAMEKTAGDTVNIEISEFTEKTAAKKARMLEIKIRDQGPGLEEKVKNRIFDPFFTTKERGTGLGLALSHQIIEEHNGWMRAENHPQGGAIFYIYLPLVNKPKNGKQE